MLSTGRGGKLVRTARTEIEEEDLHEAEGVLTMTETPPQACRTKTRQGGNLKRWGHEGFDAVWGGR